MHPLVHPRATRRFSPPLDWDAELQGDCGTLEIADFVEPGGVPMMESLWQPSVEELNALFDGGSIVLRISGTVHPVVSLYATPAPAVPCAEPPAGAEPAGSPTPDAPAVGPAGVSETARSGPCAPVANQTGTGA